MVVELISVGTEILLGNIVNTNASYLAKKCALLGLSLYHQTVVAVFNFSKGGGFYSLSKSPEGAEQRAGRGQLFQYGGLYLHRCPAAGLHY